MPSAEHALLLSRGPTPEDVTELADALYPHPPLVEDLPHAGQRPKLDRFDDALFLVY